MNTNDLSFSLFEETSDLVINECKQAISGIDPKSVFLLIDAMMEAEKVYFIGVGRVMLSLQAMAKRLAHLGIDTHCVGEITEPAITTKDLLIVGSGSGESLIPVVIARKAHDIGARIAYIGANSDSTIYKLANIFLYVPVPTKTKTINPLAVNSKQPMTSLFEQSLFLLGDIIAQIIIQYKNIDRDGLWKFHANLE